MQSAEKENKPKGWEAKRLGDYAVYSKGKKPKNVSIHKTETYNIPYVDIKAFEKNILKEYTDGVGCVLCEEGDFLMVWDGARSGYVGKAIKGALGSTLMKITFPGIVQNYAYYYLLSKYLQINTRAKGTGIPHVDPYLLWNYTFPIPPLAEQRRIVEKIEELFSALDKGREYLEKVLAQCALYRQSVLKSAFEGKLTNTTVKEGELPEGWSRMNLGSIGEIIAGGTPSTEKPQYWRDEIAWISPVDLSGYKDKYIAKGKKSISQQGLENSSAKLMPSGSVLFSSRAPIGYVAIAKNELCTNQGFKSIVPKKEYLSEYIYYFLKSDKKQADDLASGTTFKEISKANFSKIIIPIPKSIAEQEQIVQEIEKRLSVNDHIEQSVQESLAQTEALRQSILKKAFEGSLVPQNPDDEPAAILLERIKAEREAELAQKEKKTIKKTSPKAKKVKVQQQETLGL